MNPLPPPSPTRRAVLVAAAAAVLLGACTSPPTTPTPTPYPPIVFVHGNGDGAGIWTTTIWRFESNGWPRERLHAIDVPYPLARDDDTRPQEGRTSTAEHMAWLATEVRKTLACTGASKVVLIASSRGGNAVRNFIANGGGAALVSHAILGGTPNHGVYADPAVVPGSEFNGAGPFLRGLNAAQANGDEVTPGIRWLTIRSDREDKYAQPDGAWIGRPGVPTNVGYDGPALRGAENVVVPGADHRETAFGAPAFAAMFRFLTGTAPASGIVAEPRVVLDGVVSGLGLNNRQGGYPTNLPLSGATVEVYATDPATGARRGAPLHRQSVNNDGRWGPMETDPRTTLEFIVGAPGYATTHVYRSPFARSSSVVGLHAERLADADRDAKSVVTLVRPRGYFGVPRDTIALDGRSPPAGIPSGVPGVASAKLKVADAAGRAVAGEFDGERIVGRAWPAADDHVVVLELTY